MDTQLAPILNILLVVTMLIFHGGRATIFCEAHVEERTRGVGAASSLSFHMSLKSGGDRFQSGALRMK